MSPTVKAFLATVLLFLFIGSWLAVGYVAPQVAIVAMTMAWLTLVFGLVWNLFYQGFR